MALSMFESEKEVTIPKEWLVKLKANKWHLTTIVVAFLITVAFSIWYFTNRRNKTVESWSRLGNVIKLLDVDQRLRRITDFQRFTQMGIRNLKIAMLPGVIRAYINREITLESIPEWIRGREGKDVQSLDQLSVGTLPEYLQEKVIYQINLLELQKLKDISIYTTAEPWVLYYTAHLYFQMANLMSPYESLNEAMNVCLYLGERFPENLLSLKAQATDYPLILKEREWIKTSNLEGKKAKSELPCSMVVLRTSRGDIRVELFEDDAENTVDNFIALVRQNFYSGFPFYKGPNENENAAWTGCPIGNGMGGPGYKVRGEINFPNVPRGYVAMVNEGNQGLVGSRFFIALKSGFEFQRAHSVLGKVNQEDMKIADSLKKGDRLWDIVILRLRPNHIYQPKFIIPDS